MAGRLRRAILTKLLAFNTVLGSSLRCFPAKLMAVGITINCPNVQLDTSFCGMGKLNAPDEQQRSTS
jgi:hypothetical protein